MNSKDNYQNEKSNISESKEKKKLRPCCACPETKAMRDQCIFEKGEENCFDFIEKHKVCLREQGFQVD